jgi:phosphate butyryltransferase
MGVSSLISALLGNMLPGPGTLYRSQSLSFARRVHVGDKLTVEVTCREKRDLPVAALATIVRNGAGEAVCEGEAIVEAPQTTSRRPIATCRRSSSITPTILRD